MTNAKTFLEKRRSMYGAGGCHPHAILTLKEGFDDQSARLLETAWAARTVQSAHRRGGGGLSLRGRVNKRHRERVEGRVGKVAKRGDRVAR